MQIKILFLYCPTDVEKRVTVIDIWYASLWGHHVISVMHGKMEAWGRAGWWQVVNLSTNCDLSSTGNTACHLTLRECLFWARLLLIHINHLVQYSQNAIKRLFLTFSRKMRPEIHLSFFLFPSDRSITSNIYKGNSTRPLLNYIWKVL